MHSRKVPHIGIIICFAGSHLTALPPDISDIAGMIYSVLLIFVIINDQLILISRF